MSATPPRLRRSLLMTPGDRPDRMLRACSAGADALVFDLEDGVSPAHKVQARQSVARVLGDAAVAAFAARGGERIVRINGLGSVPVSGAGSGPGSGPGSGLADDDVAALPLALVDALMVPKVESAASLAPLLARLQAAGAFARPRPLTLILTLETPRGMLNALAIADATPHASALFFGSGDYTSALGAAVTEATLHHPRATICAAAAAAGLQAIDAAYFADVKDAEATRRDALVARPFGFAGKVVFHPNQVAVVNAVFSPTADEVARAQRLVDTYRASLADGRGTAVTADGAFVAVDLVPPAERVLALARLVALRDGGADRPRDGAGSNR